MALLTQAKVLRILQDGRFERIGGNETIQTNVRIIAATNKDLTEAIQRKEFGGLLSTQYFYSETAIVAGAT